MRLNVVRSEGAECDSRGSRAAHSFLFWSLSPRPAARETAQGEARRAVATALNTGPIANLTWRWRSDQGRCDDEARTARNLWRVAKHNDNL
jgi:hypothetical protein